MRRKPTISCRGSKLPSFESPVEGSLAVVVGPILMGARLHCLCEEEDHQVGGHWAPVHMARCVQPLLVVAFRVVWITAALETAGVTHP